MKYEVVAADRENMPRSPRSRPVRRVQRTPRLALAAAAVVAVLALVTPTAAAAPPPRDFGRAIDDFPRYETPTVCAGAPQPGAVAVRDLVLATYGRQSIGLLRSCGGGRASSDHHEGRAVDWMLDAGDPAERALADDFIAWLLAPDAYGNQAANARRLGVAYLIWDRKTWKGYRPQDGWTAYTGPSPHTDHIHISLSWRGADMETSWWTGSADPLDSHWIRLGGSAFIGNPVGSRRSTSAGQAQDYERGGVYAPVGGRPRAVHGAIGASYRSRGAETSVLRFPLTDELPSARGGAHNIFQGGAIHWSPSIGARATGGSIDVRWAETGRERGILGYPLTDETPTPTRPGAYNHFENGSIYWGPATGAHEVHGTIRSVWAGMGWENSALGFPTTGENRTPRRAGAYSHFQNGSIYWSPTTGAHPVSGAVRDVWARLGWENSAIGFPADVQRATPAKPGSYQHFENGSIYWSQATGGHEVRGNIRSTWSAQGWENGALGFPTTDEVRTPNGKGAYNHFQGGSVYWSPTTGAHAVDGAIRDRWASMGWESSHLGFPSGAATAVPEGVRQQFQGGAVIWDRATGATIVVP